MSLSSHFPLHSTFSTLISPNEIMRTVTDKETFIEVLLSLLNPSIPSTYSTFVLIFNIPKKRYFYSNLKSFDEIITSIATELESFTPSLLLVENAILNPSITPEDITISYTQSDIKTDDISFSIEFRGTPQLSLVICEESNIRSGVKNKFSFSSLFSKLPLQTICSPSTQLTQSSSTKPQYFPVSPETENNEYKFCFPESKYTSNFLIDTFKQHLLLLFRSSQSGTLSIGILDKPLALGIPVFLDSQSTEMWKEEFVDNLEHFCFGIFPYTFESINVNFTDVIQPKFENKFFLKWNENVAKRISESSTPIPLNYYVDNTEIDPSFIIAIPHNTLQKLGRIESWIVQEDNSNPFISIPSWVIEIKFIHKIDLINYLPILIHPSYLKAYQLLNYIQFDATNQGFPIEDSMHPLDLWLSSKPSILNSTAHYILKSDNYLKYKFLLENAIEHNWARAFTFKDSKDLESKNEYSSSYIGYGVVLFADYINKLEKDMTKLICPINYTFTMLNGFPKNTKFIIACYQGKNALNLIKFLGDSSIVDIFYAWKDSLDISFNAYPTYSGLTEFQTNIDFDANLENEIIASSCAWIEDQKLVPYALFKRDLVTYDCTSFMILMNPVKEAFSGNSGIYKIDQEYHHRGSGCTTLLHLLNYRCKVELGVEYLYFPNLPFSIDKFKEFLCQFPLNSKILLTIDEQELIKTYGGNAFKNFEYQFILRYSSLHELCIYRNLIVVLVEVKFNSLNSNKPSFVNVILENKSLASSLVKSLKVFYPNSSNALDKLMHSTYSKKSHQGKYSVNNRHFINFIVTAVSGKYLALEQWYYKCMVILENEENIDSFIFLAFLEYYAPDLVRNYSVYLLARYPILKELTKFFGNLFAISKSNCLKLNSWLALAFLELYLHIKQMDILTLLEFLSISVIQYLPKDISPLLFRSLLVKRNGLFSIFISQLLNQPKLIEGIGHWQNRLEDIFKTLQIDSEGYTHLYVFISRLYRYNFTSTSKAVDMAIKAQNISDSIVCRNNLANAYYSNKDYTEAHNILCKLYDSDNSVNTLRLALKKFLNSTHEIPQYIIKHWQQKKEEWFRICTDTEKTLINTEIKDDEEDWEF